MTARFRSAQGAWLVAGALALWLLAWLLWTAWLLPSKEENEEGVYVAVGYLEAVSLFLRHDWLEFDPATETVDLSTRLEDEEREAIEGFYRESYLVRDVAAFNAGDLSVFRIDNGRILAIDPHRRNAVLPFSELRHWQGRLTYRPAAVRRADLVGAGVHAELLAPFGSPVPGATVPNATLAGRGREPDVLTRVSGEAVNLVGEGGPYLGQARLLGGAVVFNFRNDTPGLKVSVSGESVARGNRIRLDSGDLLKITWRLGGQRSTYALLTASVNQDAPVISSYRPSNGAWRRWPPDTHPPAPANPAWTEDVVAAMNAALRQRDGDGYRVPNTGAPESVDVALTLDAAMQAELERRLAEYVEEHRPANDPLGRAAVTVMDAVTGELLALASYPRPQDLPTGPGASRATGRLGRNHNFSRLPIGSVAKVPFTAAILEAAPVLAGLEIPAYGGGETEALLGLELKPPLLDHSVGGGEDGRVGLEDYIEDSSNRYAALLLTLATGVSDDGSALRPPAEAAGDPLRPEQRFFLNGPEIYRRPRLALPVKEAGRPGEKDRVGIVTQLELLPFARRMGELFDVAVSRKRVRGDDPGAVTLRRPPGEGDDLTDTAPWKPLLRFLYRESIPVDHPFYGVSPERTHLAFNLVDDYRREYLSLILGGGNSTWTNPHVASVFARLATGRRVSPRLVVRLQLAGEDVEPEPDDAEPLGMEPWIRQRLLDALTLVAGPSGTASQLADTLRQLDGELAERAAVLGFFSKTGSPEVVTFEPTRTAQALDELIRTGAFRTDGSGRIVYRDAGVVDADVTDTAQTEASGARRVLDALAAHAADREVLTRHRVSPGSVIRAADTYNDARPEDRGRWFKTAADGRLIRARSVLTSEDVGATFAFVAARYPGAARRLPAAAEGPPRVDAIEYQPERAYAVSIFLEGLGNGPRAAVPFARKILDEVLKEELLAYE